MNAGYTLRDLKEIARKNSNIYQIVRDNRDQEVVWEREAMNQ